MFSQHYINERPAELPPLQVVSAVYIMRIHTGAYGFMIVSVLAL